MTRLAIDTPLPTPLRRHRGAFTLLELLLVIAIIALLVAILLPAIAKARQAARTAVCNSNLHQFAVGYANYSSDYKDTIATFWLRPGKVFCEYPDLNSIAVSSNELSLISAAQAVDILRRRGSVPTNIPTPTSWIPHVFYSHLLINDYLVQRLPEPMVVCPEDRARIQWQASPTHFSPVPGYPGATYANGNPEDTFRWPFSSSYTLVPAAFAQDRKTAQGNTVEPTDRRGYRPSQLPYGGRRFDEVVAPSSKVLMFDEIARHGKRPDFYAYPDTSQPLLFCDSSVRVVKTGDTNQGEHPNASIVVGDTFTPHQVTYVGDPAFEPPARGDQQNGDAVQTRYQWTRRGLRGWDVNR